MHGLLSEVSGKSVSVVIVKVPKGKLHVQEAGSAACLVCLDYPHFYIAQRTVADHRLAD